MFEMSIRSVPNSSGGPSRNLEKTGGERMSSPTRLRTTPGGADELAARLLHAHGHRAGLRLRDEIGGEIEVESVAAVALPGGEEIAAEAVGGHARELAAVDLDDDRQRKSGRSLR